MGESSKYDFNLRFKILNDLQFLRTRIKSECNRSCKVAS